MQACSRGRPWKQLTTCYPHLMTNPDERRDEGVVREPVHPPDTNGYLCGTDLQ